MGKDNETTTKFKVDISELKKGIQDAQRQIRLANAEFKAASSGMDNWASSADGISAKLKQLDSVLNAQKSVLDNLKQQYKQVVDEQGETSKGAQELAIKIANQEAAINGTKKSISKYEQALNDVEKGSDDVAKSSGDAGKGIDEVGDAAKDSDGKVGAFAKGLAGLVKNGMLAVTAAAAGVVTAFLGSAEATREYRENMNKLQTAYQSAGLSAKTAQKTYEGFFSVLGEEDRSVEAANHLAKLTKDQKELSQWTDICAGVWGTFGDSLPIEGLTEAANETAKVGQVTGPLADAINWATTDTKAWNEALSGNDKALAAFNAATKKGASAEDAFNAALASCNSEQERSTLITSTLNSLYSDAADQYKELNGDIMNAQLAQSKLNDAMAGIGAAAEPVMSSFKLFGAEILQSLVPGVQTLAKGFTELTQSFDGAEQTIGAGLSNIITSVVDGITNVLPTIANVGVSLIGNLVSGIVGALPQLGQTAITILSTLSSGIIAALPQLGQTAFNILQMLVTGLIGAAPQLLATAGTLLETLYNGIITGIPKLIELGAQMLTNLGQGIGNNLPNLTSKALDALNGFADMLTQNLPTLINAGISFITNLAQGVTNSLPTFIEKAPEIITKFANLINDNMPKILKAAVNIIITLVKGLIKAIPTLIKNIPKIITAIVSVFTAFNWLNLGKTIITGLKNGIVKMVGAVKSAGKAVAEGAITFLKNLPGKLLQFGKSAITNLAGAFKNGISTIKNKAGDILKGIVDTFKPSSLISIGKDLIKGLWNGISDMAGWISKKIKGFGDGVLKSIKKFFGIHSPSTVMRDQVGKYISMGIAVGIEKGTPAVTKSITKLGNGVLKTFKNSVSAKDFKKYGSTLVSKLTDGVNSQVTKFNDSLQNLTDKMQSAIDEVKSKRSEMAQSLSGMGGDLYTKDESGKIVLSDLKQQTKAVEEYGKNLNKLKGKISENLMNEILAMNANDGYEFTKALLSLDSKALAEYNKAYTAKLNASNKVANAWYKKDIESLQSQYTKKVTKLVKDMVKDVTKAGSNAARGFAKAFKGNKAVQNALNTFCKDVVKTIKKKFKIKSPSRVMRDEIGKYLAEGIAVGIDKNKGAVSEAFEAIKSDLTQPIDFNIGGAKSKITSGMAGVRNGISGSGGTNNTTYTFNQYNNSPKALSRLEIYRQTKNQLNFAKGV